MDSAILRLLHKRGFSMSSCCDGKKPKKIKEWGSKEENSNDKNIMSNLFKKILKK